MFDVNEILSALRSGTDPDTLASQMADALNLANKTYKSEQEEALKAERLKKAEAEAKRKAEEEAQKKAEEQRHTEMIVDLAHIIAELLDFFAYYYDEEIPEDVDETVLAEEILNTYDSLSQFADLFGNFDFHSLFSTSDGKTTKTVKNDNGKISVDKRSVPQAKSETPVEKKACPKKTVTRTDVMSEANRIIDDFLRELGL